MFHDALALFGGRQMIFKDWKKEILAIPNLISLFRFLLIPVYMVIYLNAEQTRDYLIAGAILAFSCLTDMVDGKIARKYNMITTLGRLLDPLADKATQFTLLVSLGIRYPILWFVLALFLSKELFQLVAASRAARKNLALDGALFTGKVSTTVLFTSFVVLIIFPNIDPTIVTLLAIIDGVFLGIAFVDYIITFLFKKDCFNPLN